jgi:hypothetical protein
LKEYSVHFPLCALDEHTKACFSESTVLQIETEESTPGFARIKLGAVTGEKGEQVQK